MRSLKRWLVSIRPRLPRVASKSGSGGSVAQSRERPTILVVDDTPANLSLSLRRPEIGLPHQGGRQRRKGAEARCFPETPPDLILLDIMMPGMDGYEVCRRLKDDPVTRDIPVIFVTAMTEIEDETHGLDLKGVVDYVTKPISAPIVKARVKTHLAACRACPGNATPDREARGAGRRAFGMEPRTLERRVADEVREVERLSRLKRFFSPSVVDLLLSGFDRRSVEESPPRNCSRFRRPARLHRIHRDVGPRRRHRRHRRISRRHGPAASRRMSGTLERFAGDGIMIFFNDPVESRAILPQRR